MVSKINKNAMRLKRHVRVRGKISGTPECPRLNVFRSNANIYAQIIDDVNGVTLVSANTLDKAFEGATGNAEAAKKFYDKGYGLVYMMSDSGAIAKVAQDTVKAFREYV